MNDEVASRPPAVERRVGSDAIGSAAHAAVPTVRRKAWAPGRSTSGCTAGRPALGGRAGGAVPCGNLAALVDAAALNFADVLLCRGLYPEKPPLPFTPGLEVRGTVLDGPLAGERVLAAPGLPRGGLAEQVVVAEAAALRVPDAMAAATAASMLITYQTG